jgi:hypothetical protein
MIAGERSKIDGDKETLQRIANRRRRTRSSAAWAA